MICSIVSLLSGCSAFNPRMSPPIRSAYEEWDRETGKTVYQCEVQQLIFRDGIAWVRSFNMAEHAPGEWRRVDHGHDWDVWVARWAWGGQ